MYRGTSAGFVPSRANRIATGLTGVEFADTLNLEGSQTYWYVVRATETATNALEETNTRSVSATVIGGPSTQTLFFDDFDSNRPASAAAYWRASGGSAVQLSTCRWQSASHSYRFGSVDGSCSGVYPPDSNASLYLGGDGTTPGIDGFVIPADAATATLSFNVWRSLEDSYDFMHLLYSTGGAAGAYTYRDTWTGYVTPSNGSFSAVTEDLIALKGQRVWLQFSFVSDSIVQYEGAYLDDVRLQVTRSACTTSVPPPLPPASYELTGMPASVGSGTQVTLSARAVDALGRTATAYSGTASVTSSDPLGTISSPLTFSGGLASFQAVLRRAGPQSVTLADSTDPTAQGSASTSVAPGAPVGLSVLTPPSPISAGATFSPALQIAVADAAGNAVPSASADVTVAVAGNPSGVSLAGTLTLTTNQGVATFPDLSLTRAGTGYQLTASSDAWGSVTTSPFDVTAGAASALEFTTQPLPLVAAGAPFTVRVAARDAYGNPVSQPVTVTLFLAGATGTLSGTASAQTVDGVATFTGLSVDAAGSELALRATAPGDLSATSAPFSVQSTAATRLEVVLGTPVKQGQPVTVTVTSLNASGNPVKDDLRSVAFTSSDAKAQLPAPASLYDGRAQATVVFGSSGDQTLTATLVDDASITGTQAATVTAVDAPTVTLLTPNDGAEVAGMVQVIASATVGQGTTVSSLSILVDGTPLQSGTGNVLSATWDSTTADAKVTHEITAKIVDAAGTLPSPRR